MSDKAVFMEVLKEVITHNPIRIAANGNDQVLAALFRLQASHHRY